MVKLKILEGFHLLNSILREEKRYLALYKIRKTHQNDRAYYDQSMTAILPILVLAPEVKKISLLFVIILDNGGLALSPS